MSMTTAAVLMVNLTLAGAGEPATAAAPDSARAQAAATPSLGGPSQDKPGGKAAKGAELAADCLVELDVSGKVRRIDRGVERAALEALRLGEKERGPAESVFAARAVKLDKFVTSDIELLTKLGNSLAGNDKADQAQVLLELAGKLQGVMLEQPLELQVEKALPAGVRATYKRIVGGYWDAIAAERMAETNEKGEKQGRMAVLGDERLKALGKEIEQAFMRSMGSGMLVYSYVMKGVTVTPEQEGKLRVMFTEHAAATKAGESDEENKKLFWKVTSVLDSEQQSLVLKNINQISGKGRKPK
jgi:hypothetical protein